MAAHMHIIALVVRAGIKASHIPHAFIIWHIHTGFYIGHKHTYIHIHINTYMLAYVHEGSIQCILKFDYTLSYLNGYI